MATNIGRVGMVLKGNYSSASSYEVLDVVSYSGGLYIAKQAVPAGTAPTNTTYWQSAISLPSQMEIYNTYTNLSTETALNIEYDGYVVLESTNVDTAVAVKVANGVIAATRADSYGWGHQTISVRAGQTMSGLFDGGTHGNIKLLKYK